MEAPAMDSPLPAVAAPTETASDPVDPSLRRYEEAYLFDRSYFRVVSRSDLLRLVLRELVTLPQNPRLLDLGCETGINLDVLGERGEAMGLDVLWGPVAYARTRGPYRVMQCRGEALAFRPESFDFVCAFDVFEHIRDDVDAMGQCRRVLRPGGHLLATVPTFGFLWSEHDEALEHCRRYTRLELVDKLEACGFRVVLSSYILFALFFPALVVRLAQAFTKRGVAPRVSRQRVPGWANRLLLTINRLEVAALRHVRFPVGVSCVALARRP
jgi:SAM-dependent methyltransferase